MTNRIGMSIDVDEDDDASSSCCSSSRDDEEVVNGSLTSGSSMMREDDLEEQAGAAPSFSLQPSISANSLLQIITIRSRRSTAEDDRELHRYSSNTSNLNSEEPPTSRRRRTPPPSTTPLRMVLAGVAVLLVLVSTTTTTTHPTMIQNMGQYTRSEEVQLVNGARVKPPHTASDEQRTHLTKYYLPTTTAASSRSDPQQRSSSSSSQQKKNTHPKQLRSNLAMARKSAAERPVFVERFEFSEEEQDAAGASSWERSGPRPRRTAHNKLSWMGLVASVAFVGLVVETTYQEYQQRHARNQAQRSL